MPAALEAQEARRPVVLAALEVLAARRPVVLAALEVLAARRLTARVPEGLDTGVMGGLTALA